MFNKLFHRNAKADRRASPCGDPGCCQAHPNRREDDYRAAVSNGIASIKKQASDAVEGLDQVTACLAKRGPH